IAAARSPAASGPDAAIVPPYASIPGGGAAAGAAAPSFIPHCWQNANPDGVDDPQRGQVVLPVPGAPPSPGGGPPQPGGPGRGGDLVAAVATEPHAGRILRATRGAHRRHPSAHRRSRTHARRWRELATAVQAEQGARRAIVSTQRAAHVSPGLARAALASGRP